MNPIVGPASATGILNRVLAAVLGIALAAFGLLVTWETVAVLLGRGPMLMPYESWIAAAEPYRWDSPQTLLVSAGAVLVGLLLMGLQLVPRRRLVLEVELSDPSIDAVVDRSGLERSLQRAATDIPGVTGAKTRALRNRVTTTVDVAGGGDRELVDAVNGALQGRLDRLRVKPVLRLSVNSRAKGRAR